jgi:hypothetical protein
MPALDHLQQIWPPPPGCRAFCTPQVWDDVEHQIGVRPPPDFQQLLAAYGSGFIGLGEEDPYWLVIRSPLSRPGYGNLVDAFRKNTALVSERKSLLPEYEPYPILPTAGGLFPFAHDSTGFEYYWLTKGDPGDWPLVIDTGTSSYLELDMSFTDFLLRLVKGEPPHESFAETKDYPIVWTPLEEKP